MNTERDTKLASFLAEIAPYVVVVGSFARNQETELSDIDCYLRNRPVEEVDPELGNETYMPEILEIIEKHELSDFCDSVLVGHIAVERTSGFSRMVEVASYYRIPISSELFYREIEGVKMLCAADNKDTDLNSCYDNADWDEDVGDMVIKNPLPPYNPPVKTWYDICAKFKENKVVVKLRDRDGSYLDSCIIPTDLYPLNNKYEVFTYRNTKPVLDEAVLKIFDKVKYQIGHCYTNTENLVEALCEAGYDAKSYVGWLFVAAAVYPIHHCWVVLNGESVLDLSDDHTMLLHNFKHFDNLKDINEARIALAEFHEAAKQQPNSVRCQQVGTPSINYLYVGCPCPPDAGKLIYNNMMRRYPNHPTARNVDKQGFNPTQRMLKDQGLMQVYYNKEETASKKLLMTK